MLCEETRFFGSERIIRLLEWILNFMMYSLSRSICDIFLYVNLTLKTGSIIHMLVKTGHRFNLEQTENMGIQPY
jgi:hypothetical protein